MQARNTAADAELSELQRNSPSAHTPLPFILALPLTQSPQTPATSSAHARCPARPQVPGEAWPLPEDPRGARQKMGHGWNSHAGARRYEYKGHSGVQPRATGQVDVRPPQRSWILSDLSLPTRTNLDRSVQRYVKICEMVAVPVKQ